MHHLFASFAHVLVYFAFAFALTRIFLPCADLMLGKGKLAYLRALARTHKLATGSQTVPNSVVEIAAAQGRSSPQGPTPPETLPAPQRKKLILRKPKRKTPQVVQEDEDEDDEATEDGLVTKRKRVAPSSPPALPTPTPPSPPAPTPPVQAIPLAAALPVAEGNGGLKQQNEELELSSAQVLTAGFDAALEQVACQYPELDLSMVSILMKWWMGRSCLLKINRFPPSLISRDLSAYFLFHDLCL